MALAKSIYAVPTWTKTVALIREYVALRLAICKWWLDLPSVYGHADHRPDRVAGTTGPAGRFKLGDEGRKSPASRALA